jgi:hypothetical protein
MNNRNDQLHFETRVLDDNMKDEENAETRMVDNEMNDEQNAEQTVQPMSLESLIKVYENHPQTHEFAVKGK